MTTAQSLVLVSRGHQSTSRFLVSTATHAATPRAATALATQTARARRLDHHSRVLTAPDSGLRVNYLQEEVKNPTLNIDPSCKTKVRTITKLLRRTSKRD